MKKLILLLIFLQILPAVQAQEYSFENKKIAKAIESRLAAIGNKIYLEAKNGRLPAYHFEEDTLVATDRAHISPAWRDTSFTIEGLSVQYSWRSKPGDPDHHAGIQAIAPMAPIRLVSGINLPIQPLLYVKPADLKKVLSASDIKFIYIISDLLFAANAPEVYPERIEQDLTDHTLSVIGNKLSKLGYQVKLTGKQLEPLNILFLYRIPRYFEDHRSKNLQNEKTGFFKDSLLKNEFSKTELQAALVQKTIYDLPDPADTSRKVPTVYENPINFSRFGGVLSAGNAIGVRFKYETNDIVAYMPKAVFYKLLPEWEMFLLKEIL
jgi:hypothetical protein